MKRGLFLLLCLSVWINYIDRGNLSVAAPLLGPEMHLNSTRLGVLLSAFFWTYSLAQPFAGWLVDRFDVYRVYAAGFALWSLAVVAGGLAGSFEMLFLSRLALGVGESIAYPSYSRIIAGSFEEGRRGLANAMIDVGTKAGPAVGTLLGGLVIQAWGWRPFFLWMGGLTLLWLIPWMALIPAAGSEHAVAASARRTSAPWSAVLKRRDAWITFFGLFCFNYTFYFLLTWLPSYLVAERKFSLRAMAIYGALPFCATAISSLSAAAWTDRQIRLGSSAWLLRRRVAVTGLVIAAAMLLAAVMAGPALSMVCLVIAFVGIGMFTGNAWAITQTLAGRDAAGTWTGWQNAVGNMGGVVAPILTGWSVAVSGSFFTAFAIAAGMLLTSALLYGAMLGSAVRRAERVQSIRAAAALSK